MIKQNPFKGCHFQTDIILLCVRWYLRYSLSYRDLEEMILERGFHIDHTTISRLSFKNMPRNWKSVADLI
jgi:transposase, IS6 family